MSKKSERQHSRILKRRKQEIERRLTRKQWEDQESPMFKGRNIHYEVAEKIQAINCGGIGVIHQMVQRCGLVEEINAKLKLLKVHVPYHESDHVLNIAYNILVGGMRLEDIGLNRNNEGYLNAVGAQRIPDPTTAGDFTRRFTPEDIGKLMGCINTVRSRVWKEGRKEKLKEALIDDIRYFFYITTLRDRTAEDIVELVNGRCDQENVIEQLKNGVNAMRMPVRDLESNWAYMVMAALSWNLKARFLKPRLF